MSAAIAAVRRPASLAAGFILLTMSLGVLIAQIDTSVVNLALTQIDHEIRKHGEGDWHEQVEQHLQQVRLREAAAKELQHAAHGTRPGYCSVLGARGLAHALSGGKPVGRPNSRLRARPVSNPRRDRPGRNGPGL